jgi:hypothetical protein
MSINEFNYRFMSYDQNLIKGFIDLGTTPLHEPWKSIIINSLPKSYAPIDIWGSCMPVFAERIPAENLRKGDPRIVFSCLSGLSICDPQSLLAECYTSLLCSCIDNRVISLIHPSFPLLLEQLCDDELRILSVLKTKPYKLKQRSDMNPERVFFVSRMMLFDEFPASMLNLPTQLWLYMNHLHKLGLAGTYQVGSQEIIDDHAGNQIGVYINSERRLDEFGEYFTKSCIPDIFKNQKKKIA